jgi:ribosomal protein S18 acetylase RimI-like enzyme
MTALARREGMQAFERDPLSRGPWYGVWHPGRRSQRSELIAQGGTHLVLDQAAEIGNIVTARAYRRRGYGSHVVAALLRELSAQGYSVFLHVLKGNGTAIAFYESLGFERNRGMILARCRV